MKQLSAEREFVGESVCILREDVHSLSAAMPFSRAPTCVEVKGLESVHSSW